jgi:hypothetical protein
MFGSGETTIFRERETKVIRNKVPNTKVSPTRIVRFEDCRGRQRGKLKTTTNRSRVFKAQLLRVINGSRISIAKRQILVHPFYVGPTHRGFFFFYYEG